MSTNKTTNYQLHSWQPQDTFLLSEMNENFATLDGKLHEEVATLDGQIKAEAQAAAAGRTALGEEIAQKADQTALTAEIQKLNSALTSGLGAKANSSTVTTLEKTVQSIQSALGARTQIYLGSYTGTGDKQTQTITLDFKPLAILTFCYTGSGNGMYMHSAALATQEIGTMYGELVLTENGFTVKNEMTYCNIQTYPYIFLAFY